MLYFSFVAPPQDLFSALIKGPTRTPYEDGVFLFDIQLPNIYPAVPPLFRYLSQCSGRLNPNLYDNGKVCVSLLGTWIGKVSAGGVDSLKMVFVARSHDSEYSQWTFIRSLQYSVHQPVPLLHHPIINNISEVCFSKLQPERFS